MILSTLRKITVLKEGLNLVYINYDRTNGFPDILKANEDNDYPTLFQDCLLMVV